MKKAIPIIIVIVLLLCGCLFFGLRLLVTPQPVLDSIGTDLFTDPEFDPEILSYTASVPYETERVAICPTADEDLTVSVEGGDNLQVGENDITITVVNSKEEENVYKLKIEREKSGNCALKELSAEGIEITPAFSEDVYSYTAKVDYFTSSINLSALPFEEETAVEITGADKVDYGNNTVSIKTLSPNGKNTAEYVVNVYRDEVQPDWRTLTEHGYDKFVAITFDDGPSDNTLRLLDILDKHRIKATFFVVGSHVNDTTAKCAARGHEIGNHSWDHSYMNGWSDEAAWGNVGRCSEEIKSYTGKEPVVFRPPGGLWTNGNPYHGLRVVYWSVDPQDWNVRDKDKVRDHILKHTANGDIVLLHDLYPTSVDAADEVIGELKKQDYVFLTVSEMLEYRAYINW